jgi:hypothetical protein
MAAPELHIPHQPWPAAKISCDLCQTVTHGQNEAVPGNSLLAAQGIVKCFPKADCRILNKMMSVHFKISFCPYGKVKPRVPGYLIKHVIKKAYSGANAAFTGTVDIKVKADIGFLRFSGKGGSPWF